MGGRFLVLEGMDGSGKSTQARRLVAWLEARGRQALHLREPGATPLGERLRGLLLEPGREAWDPRSEALLFFAARNELLRTRVAPALAAGRDVVCERFTPSTLAYQAQEPGLVDFVLALDDLVVPEELQPHLVLVLDLDPATSLARAGRQGGGDAFEARGLAFQEAVRAGYLAYARRRPEHTRLLRVDGLDADTVAAAVQEAVAAVLEPGPAREGGGR